MAAGDPFEWTDEAEKAYNALMDAILQGPTLRSFQTNRRSEVVVDASETTIGAVLEQDSHPAVFIDLQTTLQGRSQLLPNTARGSRSRMGGPSTSQIPVWL